ncbi:PRC-barrel domain-containing protein [Streptomyces thermolineatus]
MIEAEDVRDWRGHDVVDPAGDRIGTLEAVYVDTATDRPVFVTVRVGLLGRHRLVFAPLDGAVVGPGRLKVAHSRKTVKSAPSIDVDGELPAEEEPAVFQHYSMTHRPGAGGERRLARR